MDRGANGKGSMIGGDGTTAGADSSVSGMLMAVDPPPEGLRIGMNTGVDDLLLMVLLQPLRRA